MSWLLLAAGLARPKQSTAMNAPSPQLVGRRFLLWIDAVGGYLVCLASEVTFG